MQRPTLVAFLLAAALPCAAAELPATLNDDPKGGVRWHGVHITHAIIYGNWQSARKEAPTVQKENGALVLRQKHVYPEALGGEVLRVVPRDAGSLRLDVETSVPDSIKPELRYVSLSIPVDKAGKLVLETPEGVRAIPFPADYEKTTLGQFHHVRRAEIFLKDGNSLILHPEGKILFLQDDRAYQRQPLEEKTFSLRVWHGGDSFSMNMEESAAVCAPVDISAAALRPMQDDVADDGQGGWTDQGAQNDMRMFVPGVHRYDNLIFKVDQPRVLAVVGKNRSMPAESMGVDLPPDTDAKTLALLHTSAWTPREQPLGEIEIVYADTGIQRIPVIGQVDCGNWWDPTDHYNAKVAWTARNGTTNVGFYVSTFPLTGAQPVRVNFTIAHPDAVWLVAGLSLVDREVAFQKEIPVAKIMQEDDDWVGMNFEHRTVAGSPLDFSFIIRPDAPAGKYGRAVPHPDGSLRFEKEPDKKLRLVGTNLCESAAFPDKENAVLLADYIVSMGINSVRFHHHDNGLADPNSDVSTDLNRENLDRLEFLFAELKKRGVYISFDLYTSRKLRPGDGIPEKAQYPKLADKRIISLTQAGRDNLKTFARNWLTHVNPYTGMNWLDDPAIVFVNLVNEDTLTYAWSANADQVALLSRLFEQYARDHKLEDTRLSTANPAFFRFMYDTQKEGLDDLTHFVKEELKAVWPVTSCNYGDNAVTHLLRNAFPVADTHMYHDHPSFPQHPWALPHAYSQTSTLKAGVFLPTGMIRNRIHHKPFFLTEFNFCAPNRYRAEDGPLMGAYSALQDIAGMYRFDFLSNARRFRHQTAMVVFESVSDPIMQLSDRIIAALFLRGDVRTAAEKYAYTIPADFFSQRRDTGIPGMAPLRMIAGVGVQFADQQADAYPEYNMIDNPAIARKIADYERTGVAVSVTDQLRLDTRNNTFAVVTPRTETLTLPKGDLYGDRLSVTKVNTYQAIAAISLTGAPLAESDSILILQVPDVSQTGVRFANQERTILEKTSTGRLLLRRAVAEISLTVQPGMTITAYNIMGEPVGRVDGNYDKGVLHFTAINDAFPGGAVAYHLTR